MRNKIQPAIIKRKPPSSTARRAGWIGCNFNLSRIPAEAYAFTRELEKLHPDNRHVRDKIHQQLQVLRDRSATRWFLVSTQKPESAPRPVHRGHRATDVCGEFIVFPMPHFQMFYPNLGIDSLIRTMLKITAAYKNYIVI
jgi:Dam-replacing HTH domain/Dam-replacing family